MASMAAKTSADAGRASNPGDLLQCGSDTATTKDNLSSISNSPDSESPAEGQ